MHISSMNGGVRGACGDFGQYSTCRTRIRFHDCMFTNGFGLFACGMMWTCNFQCASQADWSLDPEERLQRTYGRRGLQSLSRGSVPAVCPSILPYIRRTGAPLVEYAGTGVGDSTNRFRTGFALVSLFTSAESR